MAVIEGGSSLALMGVGAENSSPAHVVNMPVVQGSGGYYSLSGQSGTMVAAIAAGSEIFQFRYVTAASRLCLIRSVSISAGTNLAATAAALLAFRMTAARSWTAAGSGGTRLAVSGNNCKLRTSHATSEVNDAGIASTAALTVGTKTLDATDLSSVAFGLGTGALTVSVPLTVLPPTIIWDSSSVGDHPIIFGNQEGFVIRTGANAFPLTMTWNFAVTVSWSEVPNF